MAYDTRNDGGDKCAKGMQDNFNLQQLSLEDR